MAFDMLPFPHITASKPEEQVSQINNYLIQLKETLEFILTSISYDNLSPELHAMLTELGADIKTRTEEQNDQIQQLASKNLTISDVINSAPFSSALDGVREEIPTEYLVSIEQIEESEELGGINVYFVQDKSGVVTQFTIRNGSQGPKGDTPTVAFEINFTTGQLEYTTS